MNEGPTTEGSRHLELHVEPLPPNTWIELGARREGRSYRYAALLRQLRVIPQGVLVELRDSAGLIHWEPGWDELPWAGRVFSELLKELYDEQHWRMNLWLFAATIGLFEKYARKASDVPWQDGERRYAAKLGLSWAFDVTFPDEDSPEIEYTTHHWWSPKRSLSPLFADTYSDHTEGQVAPWPDRGELERCITRRQRPARYLDCLLRTCRFVFQGYNRGEAIILLSRQVGPDDVRAAAQRPRVQAALRTLSRKARFVEWTTWEEEIEGESYTACGKP